MSTNLPISKIIKDRIKKSGKSFRSNENISGYFYNPEEKEALINEVTEKMQAVLESLIIDTNNDHNTLDTARRVAKMFINETMSGRYNFPPSITTFPNASVYDQLYITGPIEVRSLCAHHLQNFTGVAYVGVFPGTNVIGLSKFNRIVDWFSSRPTIQEELTVQIADEIEKLTKASGVAVIIKANHNCMSSRGVKAHENDFTTSIMRGYLRDDKALRQEFFSLLSGMKGWKD